MVKPALADQRPARTLPRELAIRAFRFGAHRPRRPGVLENLSGALACEVGKHLLNLADGARFTRSRFKSALRRVEQIFGVKTGSQAFEAHRRNIPIAIAARPAQQIKLLVRAVDKGTAQLMHQRMIIACCRSESRIERSTFIRHTRQVYPRMG